MVDYKKIAVGLAVLGALGYGALNMKGCYDKDQAAKQEQEKIEAEARKAEASKIPSDRYLTIVNTTQRGKVGHSVSEMYSSTGASLGYNVQFEAFDESEQNANTHGVDNNRIDNGETVYLFRIKIGNEEDLQAFLGRAKDGWRVKYKGKEQKILPVGVTNIITGNYEDLDFDKPLGFSYEGTDSDKKQDARLSALESRQASGETTTAKLMDELSQASTDNRTQSAAIDVLQSRGVGITRQEAEAIAAERDKKTYLHESGSHEHTETGYPQ